MSRPPLPPRVCPDCSGPMCGQAKVQRCRRCSLRHARTSKRHPWRQGDGKYAPIVARSAQGERDR